MENMKAIKRVILLMKVVVKSVSFLIFVIMFAINILLMTSSIASNFASAIIKGLSGVTTVTQKLNNKIIKTSKLVSMQANEIKGLKSTTAKQANKIKTLTMLNPNRLVNFRGTQMTVAKAVNTTTNGIIKRVATASVRTVASVPAQSIPLLGISAVIGISGLELMNYCETAKEMSELNLVFNPGVENTEVNNACGLEIPSKSDVWKEIKSSPATVWETAKSYSPDMPKYDDGGGWRSLIPWGESE